MITPPNPDGPRESSPPPPPPRPSRIPRALTPAEATSLPPQIQAAFSYISLCVEMRGENTESGYPQRALDKLEQTVYKTALRTVNNYLLGETDYDMSRMVLAVDPR